jgi:putative membrane protein
MISALALGAVAAHHWVGPVGGGFGFLFLLIPLFWIVVLGLIFSIVARRARRFGRGPWGHYGHPAFGGWANAGARSAEATLAERFAQGDIDEKEYRARLEVLRANNPQPPVS